MLHTQIMMNIDNIRKLVLWVVKDMATLSGMRLIKLKKFRTERQKQELSLKNKQH